MILGLVAHKPGGASLSRDNDCVDIVWKIGNDDRVGGYYL